MYIIICVTISYSVLSLSTISRSLSMSWPWRFLNAFWYLSITVVAQSKDAKTLGYLEHKLRVWILIVQWLNQHLSVLCWTSCKMTLRKADSHLKSRFKFKGFVNSTINSELKEARGPNPPSCNKRRNLFLLEFQKCWWESVYWMMVKSHML
jgi:hypothetical protein